MIDNMYIYGPLPMGRLWSIDGSLAGHLRVIDAPIMDHRWTS